MIHSWIGWVGCPPVGGGGGYPSPTFKRMPALMHLHREVWSRTATGSSCSLADNVSTTLQALRDGQHLNA